MPSVAVVAVEGLAFYFDAPYTYLIPEKLYGRVVPGVRVLLPFGNGNRKKQGLVLRVEPLCEASRIKLKPVSAVLDEAPLFSSELLKLTEWLSDNTFCSLFDAAKAMLPSGISLDIVTSFIADETVTEEKLQKLSLDERRIYDYLAGGCAFVKKDKLLSTLSLPADSKLPEKLVKAGILTSNTDSKRRVGDLTVKNARLSVSVERAEELLPSLTSKQKSVVKLLLDIGCASVKEMCYFTGVTQAVPAALEKKGIIELFDSEVYRAPSQSDAVASVASPELTNEQAKAFLRLFDLYSAHKPAVSLLYGVTGSGKTQVFLKLIEKVINDGRGVIVMVPEIALTPQTLNIFYAHFGESVAVFHSALSAGERLDEWKRVKNGKAKIAIGTRSAVFAPFSNLGLIVIDEEQEHTYKSEMSPRYHARDVAKFRCAYNDALLVLSSATPSLESYKNALDGKYSLVKLTKRYGNAVLPEVETVDMTGSSSVIGPQLYKAVSDCISNKKQAILLMNRRGFNTFAVCEQCKTVLSCPNCSIPLTYHKANNRLMCHYCGYSREYTATCPECHGNSVKYSGVGTQLIEDEIERMFPTAKVLRMDADTTMSRYSYAKNLTAFKNGEYDIMLGTQMVAKGLDFPNVTLVGIISIDGQLFNDDFRSSERAFDLLTQVIGRSGRGNAFGKALIQTVLPENEIIMLSAKQDYDAFYNMEIAVRKAMLYPPFCDICVLCFTSDSFSSSLSGASAFIELIKNRVADDFSDVKLLVMGPITPRYSKINNKYRQNVMVKCKNNKRFRKLISELLKAFMKDSKNGGVSVIADINPL